MISKVLTIFLRNLGKGREDLTFSWSPLVFLCSIWIHWNKTRPFMCLENVTEHLPLNLRNPLSTFLLSPHLENLQELFYPLQFLTYTMSLVLWTLSLLSGTWEIFLCFLHRALYPLLWSPVSSIGRWRALRELKKQVLDYCRISSQESPDNQLI